MSLTCSLPLLASSVLHLKDLHARIDDSLDGVLCGLVVCGKWLESVVCKVLFTISCLDLPEELMVWVVCSACWVFVHPPVTGSGRWMVCA